MEPAGRPGAPFQAGGTQPDLRGLSPGSADPPTTPAAPRARVSPSRLPRPLQAGISASNIVGTCLHLSECLAPCCFPLVGTVQGT